MAAGAHGRCVADAHPAPAGYPGHDPLGSLGSRPASRTPPPGAPLKISEPWSALGVLLNRFDEQHKEFLETSRAIAASLREDFQSLTGERSALREELDRLRLGEDSDHFLPPKEEGSLARSGQHWHVGGGDKQERLDSKTCSRSGVGGSEAAAGNSAAGVVHLEVPCIVPKEASGTSMASVIRVEHPCVVPEEEALPKMSGSHGGLAAPAQGAPRRPASPTSPSPSSSFQGPRRLHSNRSATSATSATSARSCQIHDHLACTKNSSRLEVERLLTYQPRTAIARFVFSRRFECAALLMVVLNSVMIAVQTDYMATHSLAKTPVVFVACEAIFLMCFIFEVALRVAADWQYYFRGPGRVLNILDCFLILAQSMELMVSLATLGSADSLINMSYLRCFRLTRAVRIGRSVRVLALMQDLRACCMAMLTSLKPFAGAAVILGLWITVVAVYYTERALALRLGIGPQQGHSEQLAEMYGSLPRSMLTLFQAITGGIDWEVVVHLFPDGDDMLLFVAFIAFSLLVLFNIITGVVIQNVMKSAEEDHLACLMPSAEQTFHAIAPREGRFREDVLKCLRDTSLRVMVSGLTGDGAVANGEYVQSHQYFEGRQVFMQSLGFDDEETDPCVIYCLEQRHWCVGQEFRHVFASRPSKGSFPPKGKWFSRETDGSNAMVQHVGSTGRKQLKTLLRLMEIDDADVDAIFNLCDPEFGEVDMPTFLSKFVEVRSPARRLEVVKATRPWACAAGSVLD